MIYTYRIAELKTQWERQHNRKISLAEIAKATGISAPTLSRLTDMGGYVTNTRYVASLCLFFGVKPSELLLEVPHPFDPPSPATPENMKAFTKYQTDLKKWEQQQIKAARGG